MAVIAMPGGHHLNGDYASIVGHILRAMDRR
ncbi:MAG: hypothetical protein HZB24_04960 [Desulfobacterales bacterium]|nr:hypothetical protein [Desulfobacterales bacterium]